MKPIDIYNAKEREVAEHVCAHHAQTIVDNNNGLTLGGLTLAEKLAEKWAVDGFSPMCESVRVATDAVRHWVSAVGYDEEHKFRYYLSNSRLNG